ncbi:phosphoribosyltransferase family protein [Brevibacterium litoralis]|uniref:phosphoribosyltransferase family protein n=1 Tax=Brevibacterium litoralis TaxID=3138935 RepID=UPI0032EF2530
MIEFYARHAAGGIVPSTDTPMHFPAGEEHVRDTAEPEEQGFLVVVRGTDANEFVRAAMWTDLQQQRGHRVTLAVPYLPGARMDRGRPFGAGVYARLIDAVGADRVIALDPHSTVMPALVDGLVAYPAARLVDRFLGDGATDGTRTSRYAGVIAPDAGAVARASETARHLGVPLYRARKTRDFATGRLSGFECEALPETGRFLVVDDICDGGGTFAGLAEATGLGPDRLDLWVTHGVFSGRAGRLREHFGTVHTTDSHPGFRNPEVGATVHPILPVLIQEAL